MGGEKEKQVAMHKDFFDRCRLAIDEGFYMEAILMEYAAMESRLEIILGVVGLPCSKDLENSMRNNINISHRIRCVKWLVQDSPLFKSSKLEKKFFEKLHGWTMERNKYVHGLYKNAALYDQRKEYASMLAKDGLEYCRQLYNEAHRLRRAIEKEPELLAHAIRCHSKQCRSRQDMP